MGSQAPGCGQPAEAGRGKEMNPPLEPPEGMQKKNTLVSAQESQVGSTAGW